MNFVRVKSKGTVLGSFPNESLVAIDSSTVEFPALVIGHAEHEGYSYVRVFRLDSMVLAKVGAEACARSISVSDLETS